MKSIELEAELSMKVKRLEELEEEAKIYIGEIRDYEDYVSQQDNEIKRLKLHIQSLSPDLEKKQLQLKMKGVGGDADDQNRDVEHLQNRINNLQVMLALRDKNNAALTEKLNLELDNKEKMKKVVKMMSDNYTNLLKQTKSEGDSCQCTKNKKKRKEMEVQLKEKNQRIQELEDERRVLSKDIKECEEYITNQVDEMKKLASYIDRLTRDSEKRQEQKNLSTITNHIKEKEESEESSPIRENAVNERLEELETKVKEYETALMKREDDNKALSENLENERRSKEKVEEAFTKTMKIYEDLLEKNEDNEMLRAECAMYKAQIDEMKGLKATCEELRSKAQTVDDLEKEKQSFIQEIRDCNCCMINQEDKISKLMNQIESTTVERDNRENEMKQTIMDMESQIVEYARKLDSVQRELQEGVNQFSCEKLLLKSQIEELETQIEDYELNMILKDENNKVLLESLESEKLSRSRVERALESITTSDERLKEMLAQARHTIKCITQKLEEYDIERLEVQKDNQMKISELREQLMIANAIITKLRENLDQMKRVMDKNVALRTLSAQLHESAKIQVTELQDANEDLSKKSQQLTEMYDHLKQVLYEKDKTFEDLRNQLLGLRQQLDDEQKLRENTETILADVKAAGDSELSELRNVIDLSNAEINRLHQEMDSLMKTSTAGRLKMQIEQLDNENAYLKEEIQKLTGCLEKILPGYVDPAELAKLRKQVSDLNSELERQKCEVESEKKMREDMGTMLHSKINQEKESDLRIRELIMENLSLKRSRVKSPSQQAVIFLEKQPKGQYRCLYGMKGGKATPKAVPRVKKSEKATEVPRFEELEKPKGLKRRKKLKEVPRVEKVEKSTEAPNFDKIEKPKMVARLEKPKEVPRVEKIEQPKEVPRPVEREKPQESAALKEIIIANNAELSELKRQNKNLKDEIVNLKRKEAVKPVVFKEDESFAKERDKLSGQINAQKQEIADLLDKINRTPDVNETLKELQHKKEENAKLKSIIADMDDKLKNLPQFHFDTPAGAPEVDKAIVQLRKSLEWEQGRVRQLEEYWRTSENNNESLAKKNVDLEGQIAKVKNALTKLQDEKKKPSASALYEAEIKEIRNHLQNWEGQINGVMTHVKNEIRSITGQVGGEEYLQKLVNEVENLKRELLDNVLSKKRVALTSELQDKHIVEVESQLHKSLENNEVLQRKIEGLEKSLENVHKNVQVKSATGKDSVLVKSSTDDMQFRQTTELQEQLRDCKRRNDSLKKELERLHNQRMSIMSESFEFAVGGDSKRIRELEEQLRKTQEENESLRKLSDKLRARSSEKSLTFLGDDPKNKRLREIEDTMERWQKNYEGEVWKLKKEIERLTSKGGAPGSDPAEGRSKEVEGYQKHNDYLEKRIIQLEADNERLNKLVEKLADSETEEFVEGEVEEKRIRDLVEHLRELQKKNETLKTRTIQLELENGRLRNDLERITGQGHKTFEKELQRLNELERQMARNQEKYQYLRKRTMKLEIENRNLKKEYIDTLIAKEKLSLLSHDQEKRLRETNKLLKKCQDKRQNLMKRMVHLQVETDQTRKDLEIGIGKELEAHIQRFEEGHTAFKIRIAELEAENDYLKRRLLNQTGVKLPMLESESVTNAKVAAVEDSLKKSKIDEALKIKVIQLEVENEQMKKELEGMKEVKTVASVESDMPDRTIEDGADTNESLQMRAVELEIENEYLRSELSTKEKITMETGMTINRVAELEEEVQDLTAKIEQLKVKNVELELDNEYLKNEIERISKVQESMQPDLADKDTEKQNHMLKMKNDHLEIENKNLKIQLENMGNEQVSLEAHVQDKRLKEIERLLREFHDYKDTLMKDFRKKKSKEDVSGGELEEVENRLKKWQEQFDPEIVNLKKDLDRLMSREKGESSAQVQKLEGHLRESRTRIEKLETENRNMKIELDMIKKGRPIEAKLAKEVEQIMKEAAEIARKSSGGGKDLETRLKECQNTNDTLRKEKVALERHVQEKKIKELEAQIREYKIYDVPKVDPERRREKKSIVIDVQEMRVKELEAQLKDCQTHKESLKGDFEKLRKEKLTIQKDLEMKLQDCKTKNEELKTEVERFRKINDLQAKLTNDLEKKLVDCRNKNEGLEASLTKIPKDRKVSFINLHQEHQNAQERITDLEEQLEKCRHMNKKLKKEIAMRDEEKLGRSDQQQEEDKKSEDKEDKTSGPSDDESGTSEGQKGVQGSMLREVERRLIESQVANANLKQELGDLQEEKIVLQDKMKKMNGMAERLRATQTNYRGVKRELERLRKEKESVHDKRNDKKVWELEKQVRESKNRSETLKGEIERLSKELVGKSVAEDENKNLKNEVNRLTQELCSREQDIEGLKDEIDKQKLVKDELLRQMDSQQSEISKLHAKIKLLGGGEEVSSVFDELENKNQVVEKLKVTIADLERHVEDLRKQRPEVGKGDMEERRSRKLEATLQKYHDNNESLKMQIVRLETEKTNLKVELNARLEKEKKSPGSETQIGHVRKLEESLQRYQDNNESLKKKIAHLEADYQEKRVRELEEQVQKCQVNNDNLKLVTVQLEFEIKYLKKELETFVEREKEMLGKGKVEIMEERDDVSIVRAIQNEYEATLDGDNKSRRSERDLTRGRKEAWKNIISRLKKKYKEDVKLLQEQNEEIDVEDRRQDESSSTEKISTAAKSVGTDSVQIVPQQSLITAPVQQPFVQFPYTTMPWLLQQPVWTYANYLPVPQTSATTEQVDLQQLALLIDKIQNTVDKSKLMLELEKEKTRFLSQFDEEKEQRSFDFSTQDELQRISDAEPNATLFNDQQDEVSPSAIFRLNQELLKQQETKEKIDVLQTTIRDTMRELEKESQRQGSFVCRQINPSFDNKNRSLPSTSHEHSKEAMFGQQKFKNVVSKCSHLSGSVYTIPHFHAGPSSERTDKRRSRVSFLCEHSSHNAGGGSFDSFEK